MPWEKRGEKNDQIKKMVSVVRETSEEHGTIHQAGAG